jgi:hypothetical protein
MLHERGASEAEVHAYLERWGLMTPKLAAHVIRFFTQPTSRTYIITYHAGRELCRSYVAGERERFRRLLTEQVRVRDLLETRDNAAGDTGRESAGIEKAPLPGPFFVAGL